MLPHNASHLTRDVEVVLCSAKSLWDPDIPPGHTPRTFPPPGQFPLPFYMV